MLTCDYCVKKVKEGKEITHWICWDCKVDAKDEDHDKSNKSSF